MNNLWRYFSPYDSSIDHSRPSSFQIISSVSSEKAGLMLTNISLLYNEISFNRLHSKPFLLTLKAVPF